MHVPLENLHTSLFRGKWSHIPDANCNRELTVISWMAEGWGQGQLLMIRDPVTFLALFINRFPQKQKEGSSFPLAGSFDTRGKMQRFIMISRPLPMRREKSPTTITQMSHPLLTQAFAL